MRISDIIRINIKNMIELNNISYEQFANLLGYNITDVKRLLSGDLLLPPKQLERICKIFKISKEELIKEELVYDKRI